MDRGAAVVDGNVAYFMNWNGRTFSYGSSKQKWSELPKCPYQYGSLAVIRVSSQPLVEENGQLAMKTTNCLVWIAKLKCGRSTSHLCHQNDLTL